MVNDIGVPLFPYGDKGHSIGLTDQMRLHVNISDKLPGFDKVESLSFVGISSDNYPELLNLFILDLQNVLKKEWDQSSLVFNNSARVNSAYHLPRENERSHGYGNLIPVS